MLGAGICPRKCSLRDPRLGHTGQHWVKSLKSAKVVSEKIICDLKCYPRALGDCLLIAPELFAGKWAAARGMVGILCASVCAHLNSLLFQGKPKERCH